MKKRLLILSILTTLAYCASFAAREPSGNFYSGAPYQASGGEYIGYGDEEQVYGYDSYTPFSDGDISFMPMVADVDCPDINPVTLQGAFCTTCHEVWTNAKDCIEAMNYWTCVNTPGICPDPDCPIHGQQSLPVGGNAMLLLLFAPLYAGYLLIFRRREKMQA